MTKLKSELSQLFSELVLFLRLKLMKSFESEIVQLR